MAEAAVDSNMDCLLCSEECGQPVTLGCEHRFCCRCLREHWAPSDSGDCPTCKRRWSKLLPPEFASKKRDSGQSQAESSGEMEERKSPEQSSMSLTDEPGESQGAASGGEQCEQQQFYVKLKEKKRHIEAITKLYEDMLEHTKTQLRDCEDQIKAQFNLFHQFLDDEEESQLSALRKEHQEKTWIIEEELEQLDFKQSSLSDSVRSAEQQLQGQSSSLSELMESLVLTDEPEPQLRSGLLIDQATILGNLGHRVWEKMGTIVKYSPVILDPNTANKYLGLSEDLTSVGETGTPEIEVPLNPDRFTNYSCVLGSEGFSSGRHQWEVEVGDHPEWTIGVVKESVNRTSLCNVSPEEGFWCLMYHETKYSDIVGNVIRMRRRPPKIGVELDYEAGTVSFYDSRGMRMICSHTDTFTEKVFPYFSLGRAGAGGTQDIQICPINAHPKTAGPTEPIPLDNESGPNPELETFDHAQKVPTSSYESLDLESNIPEISKEIPSKPLESPSPLENVFQPGTSGGTTELHSARASN